MKNDNKINNYDCISYPIEHLHFKQRITETNKFMIEDANFIVCYVDTDITNSGAKKAVNYANKQNKIVINLYKIKTA